MGNISAANIEVACLQTEHDEHLEYMNKLSADFAKISKLYWSLEYDQHDTYSSEIRAVHSELNDKVYRSHRRLDLLKYRLETAQFGYRTEVMDVLYRALLGFGFIVSVAMCAKSFFA